MSALVALRSLDRSSKLTITPRIWCTHTKAPLISAHLLSMAPHSRTMTQQRSQPVSSSDEWRTIYHLPLISMASAFNRVKIPFGLLNAVVLPAMFALESTSQVTASTAVVVSTIGLTSLMTLALCSMVVKNLVGIIYINDTNDRLKLAYVDYWGKRHDVCIDLDDLVPESEKRKPSKLDFYQALNLYSDERVKYKLLTRFGDIEDRETFVSIFGD